MSDQLKKAAREALDAHDALRAAESSQPKLDAEGLPLDVAAWIRWDRAEYQPAYKRWDEAMEALAGALDEPTMSRHPFNFRPVCEGILQ